MQKKYTVLGMEGASHRAAETEKAMEAVEKALLSCREVLSAKTDPAAGTVCVTLPDNPTEERSLFEAVSAAGYTLLPYCSAALNKKEEREENRFLSVFRLSVSLTFLPPLLLLGTGGGSALFPDIFAERTVNTVWQIFLFLPILFLNLSTLKNGVSRLFSGRADTDSQIAVGVAAATVYSLYSAGRIFFFNSFSPDLLFAAAGALLTLSAVGDFMARRSEKKIAGALEALSALFPEQALVCRKGKPRVTGCSALMPGDCIIVGAGQIVPVDGILLSGDSLVDESVLTGQRSARALFPGGRVYAGTVNLTGEIEVRAEKTGEDTVLSGIIASLEKTRAKKGRMQMVAERAGERFAFASFCVVFFVCAFWLFICRDPKTVVRVGVFSLTAAASFSPGLAAFAAISAGRSRSAKAGVVFRSAAAMENCGEIDTLVFGGLDCMRDLMKDASSKAAEENVGEKVPSTGQKREWVDGKAAAALKNAGVRFLSFSMEGIEYFSEIPKPDGILSGNLPAEKERQIAVLAKNGAQVAMVGRCAGDIPAFAEAAVSFAAANLSTPDYAGAGILKASVRETGFSSAGFSMRGGGDAVVQSADILLKEGSFGELCGALALSRRMVRTAKENTVLSLLVTCVGICLAAFGAAGAEILVLTVWLSFLAVAVNALRLRLASEKEILSEFSSFKKHFFRISDRNMTRRRAKEPGLREQ